MSGARRGEFWQVDLGVPVGHEAGFHRPALVVSDDRFNSHGLVTVCPVGRARRDYPTRIEVEPGRSGLPETSYVQVEQLWTISADRLARLSGSADVVVMSRVDQILRYLLRL